MIVGLGFAIWGYFEVKVVECGNGYGGCGRLLGKRVREGERC